jgi:preprotein translocase subunit SecB
MDTLLQQAISSLSILDVRLHGARFRQPVSMDTLESPADLQPQSKASILATNLDLDENGSKHRAMQVIIGLGVRVVNSKKPTTIYFEIEADFIVLYHIKGEVTEAALKAFAETNSTHNVWPFWRQHVYDTLQRARLPQVEVPLYSIGTRAGATMSVTSQLTKTSKPRRLLKKSKRKS